MGRWLGVIFALGLCGLTPHAAAESSATSTDVGAPKAAKSEKRVRLVLRGISGAVKDNVSRALELRALIHRKDASDAQIARLYRRAPAQIAAALQPFGFDQPNIVGSIAPSGRSTRIVFEIAPGPETKVTVVDVSVRGPAEEDRRVRAAIRRFPLKVGSVLLHADYEKGKAEVTRALQSLGYFDAKLVVRRIALDRGKSQAGITLTWDSGDRYRFGPTEFVGSHLNADLMKRYLAYEQGSFYNQNRLLETQQRLTDSDYFASIEIEVEPPERDSDAQASDEADTEGAPEHSLLVAGVRTAEVPVRIVVSPAKRSIYTGGLAFGTDSGAGLRGGVERRYVNERGHKLLVQGEYSQRLELLAASYRLPRSADHRSSYGLGLSYKSETTDSFSSDLIRLGFERVDVAGPWLRTFSVQWLDGDFTVGSNAVSGVVPDSARGNSRMVFPELRVERREADDLQNVRQGWLFRGALRGASKAVLSDADLVQMALEGKWIRALDERQRVLIRGMVGATWTSDFARLPPELRFFAGGDTSVRGYDYQSLGPQNEQRGVIGGEHALVLSGEYEFALNDQFALAGFLDAGNACSNDQCDPELGAGLGLRWRSPVGLVRIDLGFPVTGGGGPRPHLVIGPDL